MKAEINQRIAALLENPEIEAVRVEVRTAFEVYRDAREKDVKVQKEAWDKEERPAPEQGLEKKQTILGKLQELVANEENIGKMFDAFNTLTEEWNAVGNVPGDQYRELHDQWHRLRDEFFYNVNIYKQLQEHDLQINLKKKEELIAQASQLEAVTDLKEKEMLARSYMKAWFDVGPSPRETYQELADTFFGHTRAALDAVKAHYDSIREGFQKNLEAKQALVEEVTRKSGNSAAGYATCSSRSGRPPSPTSGRPRRRSRTARKPSPRRQPSWRKVKIGRPPRTG